MNAKQVATACLIGGIWSVLGLSGNSAGGPVQAPPSAVKAWVLTGLERAMRDDLPDDRTSGVVKVARNEWESTQIAVRSPQGERIKDVRIDMFMHPSGAYLSVGDVHLYRAHQLHLTHATYRNKAFQPGWYPDALIPFRHPLTFERLEKARFTAVPFDLPADQTHSFWIDFYIPKDTMAGRYKGGFKIEIEGKQPIDIPVEVEVWDFELPERASMYTEFGSPAERMPRHYKELMSKGTIEKEPDYEKVREVCARLTTDHRMNCQLPNEFLARKVRDDGSFELTGEQIENIQRWASLYQVNCIPLPSPHRQFKDPVADREKIQRWLKSWDAALEAAGLEDLLVYTYLKDEPNDAEAYKFVQQWGKAIREAGARMKVLVVEQTKTQNEEWGNLYGAVDIWVPLFSLFDAESAAKRQALGEQIWTYTALCQRDPTPWWHTDYPLCNYRCPTWIAWKYGMKGLLYWGGLTYWSAVDDVWTQPETYQPGDRSRPIEKRPIYNGEGMLAYPARDVGFDGAVPSIRLKAIRDGLEDFDYLALLEAAGKRKEALEIVGPIAGDWYKWSVKPSDYLKARERLAAMILETMKDER